MNLESHFYSQIVYESLKIMNLETSPTHPNGSIFSQSTNGATLHVNSNEIHNNNNNNNRSSLNASPAMMEFEMKNLNVKEDERQTLLTRRTEAMLNKNVILQMENNQLDDYGKNSIKKYFIYFKHQTS